MFTQSLRPFFWGLAMIALALVSVYGGLDGAAFWLPAFAFLTLAVSDLNRYAKGC